VIELLRYLFLVRDCPAYLRSNNGSQFTAKWVKKFLKESGRRHTVCRARQPLGGRYVELFNSRIRDELLDRELFLHIDEMVIVPKSVVGHSIYKLL